MKPFFYTRLRDRVVRALAPWAEHAPKSAREKEEAELEDAMKLPPRLWQALDRLDRARVRAALARIATSVEDRAALVLDADRIAEHLRGSLALGAANVPFVFGVGPIGGPAVFHVACADFERFRAASPASVAALDRTLSLWAAAPQRVRAELVGELVGVVVEIGDAARSRRASNESELARVQALVEALEDRVPSAATDAEVASALCRAYLCGVLYARRDGIDEATLEIIGNG
jgi:hypothetical protein